MEHRYGTRFAKYLGLIMICGCHKAESPANVQADVTKAKAQAAERIAKAQDREDKRQIPPTMRWSASRLTLTIGKPTLRLTLPWLRRKVRTRSLSQDARHFPGTGKKPVRTRLMQRWKRPRREPKPTRRNTKQSTGAPATTGQR